MKWSRVPGGRESHEAGAQSGFTPQWRPRSERLCASRFRHPARAFLQAERMVPAAMLSQPLRLGQLRLPVVKRENRAIVVVSIDAIIAHQDARFPPRTHRPRSANLRRRTRVSRHSRYASHGPCPPGRRRRHRGNFGRFCQLECRRYSGGDLVRCRFREIGLALPASPKIQ